MMGPTANAGFVSIFADARAGNVGVLRVEAIASETTESAASSSFDGSGSEGGRHAPTIIDRPILSDPPPSHNHLIVNNKKERR